MRYVLIISFAILFASCEEEVHSKFFGSSIRIPDAAFARDTFGIKKNANISLTFKTKRWEWIPWQCTFPSPYYDMPIWTDVGYYLPVVDLQIAPDSIGKLSVDSTRYYDESLTYEFNNQFWAIPDTVVSGNKYEWVHAIYNSGTLPIYIDSIVAYSPNVTATCPTGELLPTHTVNMRFTVQDEAHGLTEYKFAVYYTYAQCYANSIRFYGDGIAYVFYRVNYFY